MPGVLRFYKGYVPAMMQGPLSRFGDTAANAGALALLEQYEATKDLVPAVKTLGASAAAALPAAPAPGRVGAAADGGGVGR